MLIVAEMLAFQLRGQVHDEQFRHPHQVRHPPQPALVRLVRHLVPQGRRHAVSQLRPRPPAGGVLCIHEKTAKPSAERLGQADLGRVFVQIVHCLVVVDVMPVHAGGDGGGPTDHLGPQKPSPENKADHQDSLPVIHRLVRVGMHHKSGGIVQGHQIQTSRGEHPPVYDQLHGRLTHPGDYTVRLIHVFGVQYAEIPLHAANHPQNAADPV
mmetsp:Transcript_33982/g.76117  ORF Transcript_33982/g.76117 Transcript_33982/m.76117 type:complete len:211 (-) Transcript_33982:613-1245(-)